MRTAPLGGQGLTVSWIGHGRMETAERNRRTVARRDTNTQAIRATAAGR